MNRLGRWAEQAMEGLWLAAVVFTPLFFNVYSSRVFEPDKVSLLRTIAALGAVCWALKALANRGQRNQSDEAATESAADENEVEGSDTLSAAPDEGGAVGVGWWRVPLVLPLLLYAAWYLISSLTSIDVYFSIFGSYQREEGLLSQYAYIIIGLMIIFNLRRRAQVERLVNFVIAASLAGALYGLLQHQGIDPLPWAGDVQTRIAGPMGNATFFGTWLALTVPLILYRIVTIANYLGRHWRDAGDVQTEGLRLTLYLGTVALQLIAMGMALDLIAANQRPDFMLWFIMPTGILIFYALTFVYANPRPGVIVAWGGLVTMLALLLLVCADIFFTESRGPEVGLIAELMLFALAALWLQRRWLWLGVAGAACAAGIVFLVVFNLPTSPLKELRTVPYLGRLGLLTQLDEGPGRVLLLVWQGSADLMLSDTTRLLIGYGPETMYEVYNPYYPADLQHWELRNATPDMNHNWLLDQMVWGGVVMLALFALLLFAFFSFVWRAAARDDWLPQQLLLVALGAAIAGHLVAMSVANFTAAGYVYFFAYLGLAVAVGNFGAMQRTEPESMPEPAAERRVGDVFSAPLSSRQRRIRRRAEHEM